MKQDKHQPKETRGKQTPTTSHQLPTTELQALTEALQRERADAVNIRRRHEEQIANLKNLVKTNVVRDLLPAIDNLERSLTHVPKVQSPELRAKSQEQYKNWEDWARGVQGVVKQFGKALADIGVERIKTVGEVFDPRYHEAVSMEEGDGTTEIITEELQPGYKIGEEIIRHAMVRVKMGTKKT